MNNRRQIAIILLTILLAVNHVVRAVKTDKDAFIKRRLPPNFRHYNPDVRSSSRPNLRKIHKPNTESGGNIDKCEEHFRNTTLDHFAWDGKGGTLTFTHRYFICNEYWKKTKDGMNGPLFVYLGNEAPVSKYIDSSGSMFEMAPEFGANIIFIEHRYYGHSVPFGSEYYKHMGYMTTEQAIADYVEVITNLKFELNAQDSPVIGFGGSYGGMIAAWMRMKYPHVVDGVIASSAPILGFMGMWPPMDPYYFAKTVTYDATPEAGSSAECVSNVKRFWDTVFEVARKQETGLLSIHNAMNLCPEDELVRIDDIWSVVYWVSSAINYMAMGNYNFPCGYMVHDVGLLPPFPVRVFCSYLEEPLYDMDLITAMGKAVNIYYNASGIEECLKFSGIPHESDGLSGLWTYQYCTEMFMVSGSTGINDMFWDDPWDPELYEYICRYIWSDTMPRKYGVAMEYGGRELRTASNIVFSNGEYDPWMNGGVVTNVSDSCLTLYIKGAAHHSDLFASTDTDPESLKEARLLEKQEIKKWIDGAYERIISLYDEVEKTPSNTIKIT